MWGVWGRRDSDTAAGGASGESGPAGGRRGTPTDTSPKDGGPSGLCGKVV